MADAQGYFANYLKNLGLTVERQEVDDAISFDHAGFYFKKELEIAKRTNLNVILAGDSRHTENGGSGVSNGSIISKFFFKLATSFPSYQFKHRHTWNGFAGTYGGETVYNPSVTDKIVTIYNSSVGGAIPTHNMGSQYFKNAFYHDGTMVKRSADLIVWLFGANMAGLYNQRLAQQYASLMQLASIHPNAGIIIIEDWPQYGTDGSVESSRASRELARLTGATLVPTEQRFYTAGRPASWYVTTNNTEPHLSDAGAEVVATWMFNQFMQSKAPKASINNSLVFNGENLAKNPVFSEFDGTDISNWTKTNLTLAANTTDLLTGVRSIDATIGTNGAAYIEQQITDLATLKRLSRKQLSISADIRGPIVPASTANSHGVVSISIGGVEVQSNLPYSSISGVSDPVGYGWVKKALIYQLPEITSTSTPITLRIYAQTVAGAPVSGAGKVVGIDNVMVNVGDRPLLI